MEFDDFKTAWQTLAARLDQQQQMQFALLREHRQQRARRNLLGLRIGMLLQALLGLGLILLGIACWTQNLHVPGLLASGIILHAFGVLNIALAGLVVGLSYQLDYDAPVLAIQKRLRLLLRLQVFNSNACGAPWWVMWVLVVVGFAGLSPHPANLETPTWIWISLAIGVAGMLSTWLWAAFRHRGSFDPLRRMEDGADGIRRNLRLFEDINHVEQK